MWEGDTYPISLTVHEGDGLADDLVVDVSFCAPGREGGGAGVGLSLFSNRCVEKRGGIHCGVYISSREKFRCLWKFLWIVVMLGVKCYVPFSQQVLTDFAIRLSERSLKADRLLRNA